MLSSLPAPAQTVLFPMDPPIKLDFLWAALCMVGAVFFVFRSA